MKTICFDVSNLSMRCLFSQHVMKLDPSDKNIVLGVDYDIFKYRVFDSIYKSLWQVPNTREVVLAMDDKKSWRKLYWPKYKAHRKESRDKLQFNWDGFFQTYEEFMTEITEHFPFKVIRRPNTEADDVIGVLVLNKPQNFHIVSTDKDFLQLSGPRVTIYNPLTQKVMEHPNPELFLVQESLCGQAKDNIFNVMTPLDYPDDKRKPGFGEKAFEKVMIQGLDRWLDEKGLRKRYEFNRNLMDFKKIPNIIKTRIIEDYDGYKYPDPSNIYKFFMKYNWPEYLDRFTTVENKLMELY